VLQFLWWSLVALKDRERSNPTGNLQVAAECADDDSLCRALISEELLAERGL